MEFTQEQMNFFKEEEQKLLNRFKEPKYVAYEIVTVEDLSIADVKTSSENNIFDYLAIGVVCIFKEITGCKEKKIYVWNRMDYSGKKTAQAFCCGKVTQMYENALSEFITRNTCNYILKKCFEEDKLYNLSLVDFFLYNDITCIQMGIQKMDGVSIEFEDFNDTVQAQKLAFKNLQTLLINHWLGAIQAYLMGE